MPVQLKRKKEYSQKLRQAVEQLNGGIGLSGMMDGVEISKSSSNITVSKEMADNISGLTFRIIDQTKEVTVKDFLKA